MLLVKLAELFLNDLLLILLLLLLLEEGLPLKDLLLKPLLLEILVLKVKAMQLDFFEFSLFSSIKLVEDFILVLIDLIALVIFQYLYFTQAMELLVLLTQCKSITGDWLLELRRGVYRRLTIFLFISFS